MILLKKFVQLFVEFAPEGSSSKPVDKPGRTIGYVLGVATGALWAAIFFTHNWSFAAGAVLGYLLLWGAEILRRKTGVR